MKNIYSSLPVYTDVKHQLLKIIIYNLYNIVTTKPMPINLICLYLQHIQLVSLVIGSIHEGKLSY